MSCTKQALTTALGQRGMTMNANGSSRCQVCKLKEAGLGKILIGSHTTQNWQLLMKHTSTPHLVCESCLIGMSEEDRLFWGLLQRLSASAIPTISSSRPGRLARCFAAARSFLASIMGQTNRISGK